MTPNRSDNQRAEARLWQNPPPDNENAFANPRKHLRNRAEVVAMDLNDPEAAGRHTGAQRQGFHIMHNISEARYEQDE